MAKTILAVSNALNSSWLRALGDAQSPRGALHVKSEQEAWVLGQGPCYALILLDAAGIDGDIAGLIEHLRQERPRVPIVVATTSPTWQRARLVFRAGANDYIRKSLDRDVIRKSLEEFL